MLQVPEFEISKKIFSCRQSLRLVDSPAADQRALGVPSRLEELCPGVAASVAVLCGPAQQLVLPPCGQVLSDDGHFTYLGGRLPLEPALAAKPDSFAAFEKP